LREGEDLPVVIFAHGLHSGKDSPRNTRIAQGLIDEGFATLLMDFTGHGESEGTMADVSVEQLASDIYAAIGFLESAQGVDLDRMGVCGSSLGGTAALVAAATDKRIKALVLRSAPMEGYYHHGDKVTIPTLIVQGEADPIMKESKELFQHLPGEKKLELIRGAGHLYEEPEQLDQAKNAIVQWFKDRLEG
jgi:pimeloyl-ACP methyl ester carboxylesterase